MPGNPPDPHEPPAVDRDVSVHFGIPFAVEQAGVADHQIVSGIGGAGGRASGNDEQADGSNPGTHRSSAGGKAAVSLNRLLLPLSYHNRKYFPKLQLVR